MAKRSSPGKPFVSLLFAALVPFSASAATGPSRPSTWAEAVAGTHVPNLYRVEPDLLRSAQPDAAGFQDLATLGVKTVLDLRAGHDDASEAGKAALHFLRVPMRAWSARDRDVVQALKILADRSNRPILVHCQKGADRTGMVLALYRVVIQGWSKEDALREMDEGGYHHSSWFRNLDRFVSNADVAALRRELGVPAPGTALASASADAGTRPSAPAQPAPASAAASAKPSLAGAGVAAALVAPAPNR